MNLKKIPVTGRDQRPPKFKAPSNLASQPLINPLLPPYPHPHIHGDSSNKLGLEMRTHQRVHEAALCH